MSFSPRTVVGTLIATALFSSHALAAKGGNAKLTLASSKVTVAGHPASVGSTIAPGETIVTGAHSRAEVTLSDGTVARIGQGSSFSFDGSKLTLNQGSALFNITGKSSKIVTPALVRTGGAGVVSVHASQDYNALFDLKGSDTVNGSPIVAGQAWVNERGTARTFTFDMQKMIGTSTLVTKFPQTPWVAQTAALASVQHQLIAATQRGTNGTVTTGSTTTAISNSGKPPGFLTRLASVFSGNGAVQVSGGTLNMGSAVTVNNGGSLTLSTSNSNGGATFDVNGSGNVALARAGSVSVVNVTDTASRALSIGNGRLAVLSGNTLNTIAAGGTLQVNANTGLAGTSSAGSLSLTKAGAGTLVLNGSNTYTSVTTLAANAITVPTIVSGATLTLSNASAINGQALTIPSGNLAFANGFIPGIITLPGGSSNTAIINGINASTLQLGDIVNINGTKFTVGTVPGNSLGGLTLTPAAH